MMELKEAMEILNKEKVHSETQLKAGFVGGQYEGIIEAVTWVNDFVDKKASKDGMNDALKVLLDEENDAVFRINVRRDEIETEMQRLKEDQEYVYALSTVIRHVNIHNDFE